jgi:glycosyl transferase family 25
LAWFDPHLFYRWGIFQVTDTFVINLPHRTDRRRDMERQLAKVGWSAEFFPAIRPDDAGGFPSIGARGCFLSHLEVLRRARGAERLLILEDDLNFASDFRTHWANFTDALSHAPWSIFYAGHVLEGRSGLVRLSPSEGVQCSHFMLINGPAISKLIDGLEAILSRPSGDPLGGPMHVDGAYTTIRASNPDLVTYAAFPALGHQRSSRTNVGSLRWFDRIGALAPAVRLARKIKQPDFRTT